MEFNYKITELFPQVHWKQCRSLKKTLQDAKRILHNDMFSGKHGSLRGLSIQTDSVKATLLKFFTHLISRFDQNGHQSILSIVHVVLFNSEKR